MKNYTLYLDESLTHSGNYQNKVFCMAGVIIKDDNYLIIDKKLNDLKNIIWSDLPNPQSIILHQVRVNDAEKGKINISKYPEYERFKANKNRKLLYEELGKIYDTKFMTIVGASIKENDLGSFFTIHNNPDKYLITLQLLIENYCHFLCKLNARGKILYESRNAIDNERMRDRFYHIKLMGSMYITKETMNERLMSIEFDLKDNNNSGLQIADFIPNSFARKHSKFNQYKYNIEKQLRIYRYDGGLNIRDRFGIKFMP
jgi:hypothetical protein